MALTLEELKQHLARALNEVELLEVLEITAEDIVERFPDLVEDKFDYLIEELGEEGEEE